MWHNKLRKGDKSTPITDEIVDETEEIDIVKTKLLDDKVQACWQGLPERHRAILVDYYRDKLSFEQIAKKYGYSSDQAARQTKLRALKQLHACVSLKWDDIDFKHLLFQI